MRKIINFTHATLDGYIDEPHKWSFQYADEEFQDYGLKMTLGADALLLGRVTYEGMAEAWLTRGGDPFADHVNSITKYVVASQPIDTAAWDPTVVIAGADLLEEVGRLKQADGGDIFIWGTGQLTDALAAAGLLDEYRICTSPVIKGGGEPLFRPASTGAFELLDTKVLATGAVIHAYGPTSDTPASPTEGMNMPFELFAGMRVGDYEAAKLWFERLLGSEPAFFPNEIEAVWELDEQRWLYIVEVQEEPGGGLLTMLIDDLDARVAAIGSRGIEPDEVEHYSADMRKVIYRDADGNEVGFGGRPADV